MTTLKATIVGALLAVSSVASAEFSANIAVTSDYVFRGVSQTGADPAFSAGLEYQHATGGYVGTGPRTRWNLPLPHLI